MTSTRRLHSRPQMKAANSLELVATPTAASCARSLVYLTLRSWKLGYLTEAASILMDELVTSVVPNIDEAVLRCIHVRVLLLDDGRLIVEVVDQDGKSTWRDIPTTTPAGLPRRVRPSQPASEPI